ncbi:hypothetical protein Ddye_023434 [Dipteronia dyeriana]|uniref:Pentatricopeptide repeat-containing protein n=1 Tax=Dipteronia dyeriana TaxID=168575 RepID=A0AAD9WSL3_9ROSI|nr:hypothetical protein Ddye_023434 [Dipteronia dyeriana]
MDIVMSLENIHCKLKLNPRWRFNSNINDHVFSSKTLIKKPIAFSSLSSLQHPSAPPPPPLHNPSKHTTLLVETYHEHHILRTLIQRLQHEHSCPLRILQHDGDWTKDQFWAVIKFLKNASRSSQILQVFDMWKNIEISRINYLNYKKIIVLLGEEGLMEEAVNSLQEMKAHGLRPCLQIYNSIIHGFSRNGKFDEALLFLEEMKEINLARQTDTYGGLIQAYGRHKMYDEISMCLKKMKLDGCSPDYITYNLLIREFARGGLLERMERLQKSMLSKRMHLQSSTLTVMLEVYMKFGLLENMEKCYKRLLNSKPPLKEDLIKKLAGVYIQNYMFSRLDNLGDDLASRTGRTELVWCLSLLSHACLLSRRGMDSVIQEMEESKVSWNVSVVNIILLAYLKMKDFKQLRVLLSELPTHRVKPDLVTVGVVFDASRFGFNETGTLEMWKRMGLLYESVKMDTDPLVLIAYGKGHFLRDCEEVFTSLEPYAREKRRWTYQNLIDLVMKHNAKQP